MEKAQEIFYLNVFYFDHKIKKKCNFMKKLIMKIS